MADPVYLVHFLVTIALLVLGLWLIGQGLSDGPDRPDRQRHHRRD